MHAVRGKPKQHSADKRAQKAEVAALQAQAKYAWAALGVLFLLVCFLIAYMSRSKKA